jgi:hypothetical protein
MHDRPVRNLNPGDLRPRAGAPAWPGQDGLDTGAGGPFSIFVTVADGWAALGLWCLDARYLRGLKTALQMISVFAPPSENDTGSYAAGVELKMGAGDLDLSNAATLEALCKAIAHWEEAHPVWTQIEIEAGMRLCTASWPAYRAARLAPTPPVETTDELNAAELKKTEST